jgi:DNA-binding NarL/FixJ family response regulator
MSGPPYRVLVADDHPIVREGLRAVVGTMPDFELVAAAENGRQAVDAARETAPDVVVMDLHMPELDGVSAIREILAERPEVAVVVLTMFENDESLLSAMAAGARGYLVKGAGHTDISLALRTAAAGGLVLGAAVARQAVARLTGEVTPPQAPFPELTAREREVLDLLARGSGTHDIATRLYVSPKTVRNHVANILVKLQVPDRAQAIARARAAGLGG